MSVAQAASSLGRHAESADWIRREAGFLHVSGTVWRSLPDERAAAQVGRPALFLDRDGVVVEEVDYLGDPEKARVIAGVAPTIAAAKSRGYLVVLVTNQSGVARGFYGWSAFEAVQAEISVQIVGAAQGAFDAVYACGAANSDDDDIGQFWRKPRPGMILRALQDLGADRTRSIVIGDRARDLAAGKAAGLSAGLLVKTGYGSDPEEIAASRALADQGFVVDVAADLSEAWTKVDSGEPFRGLAAP